MNVLITGGAGYLGSVLTEVLLNKNNGVVVYDNLMYKQSPLLHLCHRTGLEIIRGDVRDADMLRKEINKADVIIPLAAIVGAPACNRDPELATDVNYLHVKHIADTVSRDQMLILPNTNSGYGVGGAKVCTEESPLQPLSHYGKTKCDAEKRVLNENGISLRLATVFGTSARQRLDLLVNDFTYKAMTDGYIVLFEKHFQRNYIHIRDVVSAFVFMIDNYDRCRGNVYNVGLSSANLTKYELALKIKEHFPDFSIQCDEYAKDKDQRNYEVSNIKLESLGWKPEYNIDDGINELKKAFGMLFSRQQEFTNL